MKNIQNYTPDKYKNNNYQEIEPNIYKTLYEPEPYNSLWLEEVQNQEEIQLIKKIVKWEEDEFPDVYHFTYQDKTYYMDTDDKNIIYQKQDLKQYIYVTSIKFEPEEEYGENTPSEPISQYPLEDILEKYFCFTTDDYLDIKDDKYCYIEFGSEDLEDIRGVRSIIGKHVYNKDNGQYIDLVIE